VRCGKGDGRGGKIKKTDILQGGGDTLERVRDVGEVGNATTDDEDLALRVDWATGHQIQNGLGVLVGLGLVGGT